MSNKEKKHKKHPYICNGRFYNYQGEKRETFLLSSLYMMLRSNIRFSHEHHKISDWVEKIEPINHSINLQVTWIGHSTFLIQIGGINILTDPIFNSLTPLLPRVLPAGISLDKLPPIDYVLISHNHRDHMDAYTLVMLKNYHPGVTFLVPQGDKSWFINRNFDRVIENMWWDKRTFTASFDGLTNIEFTFLPALHWSQRGLFDYNKSLWGSWMISCKNRNIYFAGDTAYGEHFKDVACEFEHIDIALMPIGPCEPRNSMQHSHVNAEEAGQGFLDLGARHFIPMHWGTYYLGSDDFLLPLERLFFWWQQEGIDHQLGLRALKIGQRMLFPEEQKIIKTPEKPTIITPEI